MTLNTHRISARRALRLLIAALAGATLLLGAFAQSYSDRPIRLLMPAVE